jgi:competence protein ComEC
MERRPVVALAAATVIGAALATPIAPEQRLVVTIGLAALCLAATLPRKGSARFRAAVAIALVAGATSATMQQWREPHVTSSHTQRFRCTVLGDVQEAGFASSFSCALDSGATVAVHAAGRAPAIGAHLLLRGRMEPFDEPRNPGEPSERSLERDRGVFAQISSARVLAILPPSRATFAIVIARVHAWAIATMRERLGEPAASILAGELWGDRGSMDPALRAEFQETGTVHVLVTAGLHLGVVAALAFALLRGLRAPRTTACVCVAAIVWLYAFFSGLHLPAMRAATMLSFALCARAYGAKALSINAVAAAALAIALCDPLAVTGASFALSFACIGAIAAWAHPLDELVATIGSIPPRVREALTLTLATQIGTWPLTAAIFGTFSPYAVLANLAVVPAVGATMLLGFAQLACAPLAPIAQIVANINGWLFAWIVGCVHAIASLPHASIPMTPAPAWAIAVYEIATLAGAWAWRRGGRTVAVLALAIAASLVVAPPRASNHRLRITVLDVGQADAIVIQTPRGHAILVDAGGRLERGPQSPGDSSAQRIGERIVVPFLLRQGIHKLDALILSHPHGDHAGGCAPVLRKLRVGEIADSGQTYGGHAYHDCLDIAHADGVPVVNPRAGTVWQTNDGVTLYFIGPQLPFIGGRNAINDNSIAFTLAYKHFRMLFTGDAGSAAEQRFVDEGVDLHADVLKVGHHGSAYGSSPAFIAAVHPRYAIISVGRHNMFGHPAPLTIETLRGFGAHVYRTDTNGAVTITAIGSGIVTIGQISVMFLNRRR